MHENSKRIRFLYFLKDLESRRKRKMTSLEQRLIVKDNNWSGYVVFCQENGLCPDKVSNLNKYIKAVEER